MADVLPTPPASELRERKVAQPAADPTVGESLQDKRIDAAADLAHRYAPSQVADAFDKAAPALKLMGHCFHIAYPYVAKAWHLGKTGWEKLQPYHPEEFMPALFGLCIAFFGGHFLTTIAAVEAFRMTGYERTLECIRSLNEDFKVVMEASQKDDALDEDGDGIADVNQISARDLATRKLRLFLISCDPMKVSDALAGIYSGLFAVVATLRVQFARAITLGATIGDFLFGIVEHYVHPVLERAIPQEYQKWISPLLKYGCKTFGVSLAWMIQRVISAFHSAIRGGQLFAKGLDRFLARRGHGGTIVEGSVPFTVVAGLVGLTGFYWQASSYFSLPFPLNILLLPVRIVEWFLMWVVAVES